MNKRTVIVSHGNPNNPSWVEREYSLTSGGIVTGDCLIPDQAPALVIMNKTSAIGKSEQRLSSIWASRTKGTPRG